MKKFLFLAILGFSFMFIGCSAEDSESPPGIKQRSGEVPYDDALAQEGIAKLKQFHVDGVESREIKIICERGDFLTAGGAYISYNGMVMRVTWRYEIGVSSYRCCYEYSDPGLLWDCNDLPNGLDPGPPK